MTIQLIISSIFLIFFAFSINSSESSYNHYLPPPVPSSKYYYSPPATYYKDDNVYITDKYGNTVAVEPYWARTAKNYEYSTRKCYNYKCWPVITGTSRTAKVYNYNDRYYYDYPEYRKVYVKDQYGNSVLVNPYDYWKNYNYKYYDYVPRASRYYSLSSARKNDHENYVYINDMYGRTRAVPKSHYLYDYARGY